MKKTNLKVFEEPTVEIVLFSDNDVIMLSGKDKGPWDIQEQENGGLTK